MSELSTEELRQKLEAGEPITVVDIREADEYAAWSIPGSRNLPVYEALRQSRIEGLVQGAKQLSPESPVVTVCRMGVISRRAAEVLEDLGFRATSLRGGIYGWGGVWDEAPIQGRLDAERTFVQLRRLGKGCLSYLVGSRGSAAVVDPCVDIAAYTSLAERERLRVTHVLETHVHADHLSRARALSEATGAALLMPANDRVRFPFQPLADGATLRVGELALEVLSTPGHTSESCCYVVDGRVLLSGDTLFLDAVGRPDLESGDAGAEMGARLLHGSLRKLLEPGRRELWVYPGHHSGPIGFDRRPLEVGLGALSDRLELLRSDEARFVERILASLGAKPPSYESILAINEGRADLGRRSPLDLEAGPNRCAAG